MRILDKKRHSTRKLLSALKFFSRIRKRYPQRYPQNYAVSSDTALRERPGSRRHPGSPRGQVSTEADADALPKPFFPWNGFLSFQSPTVGDLEHSCGRARQSEWRARMKRDGYKHCAVWIHQDALEALKARFPGERGGIAWADVAATALRAHCQEKMGVD